MKKSEFRGFGKVFSFTLVQTIKNRSYIIFTVLMAALSIFAMPVLQLIQNGGNDGAETTEIKKIYWYDDSKALFGVSFSDMGLSFDGLKEPYASVPMEKTDKSREEMEKFIENEEKDSVLARLYVGEMGLTMEVMRPSEGKISEGDGADLANAMIECIMEFKETTAGLTEEQKKVVDAELELRMEEVNQDNRILSEEDTRISQSQYWLVYVLLFVVMMVCIIASTQVASSIVMDKSTRVVEYLLTSVRPMALVMGKVLASLLASIGQVFVMFGLVLASNKVSAMLFETKSPLESLLPEGIWSNINPLNLFVCALVITLGFLFYAILAAMCGATVSKMEDTQEGLVLITITTLIGCYLGMFASTMLQTSGVNAYVIFAVLFPLSAPFLLPGVLLIGSISWPLGICAILLLLVVDLLLLYFVATIYELLITHNGNRIRIGELLGIYKSLKKKTGKEAFRK